MSQYKLIYFNIRGRGELIRLIFTYKQQKYEELKLDYESWLKMKPTTPTGKLPILEINDGKSVTNLCQSRAISRYLANKFDLNGKTDLEKAKADEIIDQINDEIDMFGRMHIMKNKEKKAIEYKRLMEYAVPLNLKYFENILSTNQTGYLIGNSLTWADLGLIYKLDFLENKKENLNKFPLVESHDNKIRSIPQIADYLAKRPVTKM